VHVGQSTELQPLAGETAFPTQCATRPFVRKTRPDNEVTVSISTTIDHPDLGFSNYEGEFLAEALLVDGQIRNFDHVVVNIIKFKPQRPFVVACMM
jgi:hypothetical protein